MTRTPTRAVLVASLVALALAPAAAAGGGVVAGKVDVTPARFQDETVVYLKDGPRPKAPATHAMDQNGMKFLPLVLAVAAGDTVEFLNHDGVEHDVFSPDGEAFHLGTFRFDDKRAHTFVRPGVYEIKCSIHPSMQGWIFVGESRYAAPVDRKGRFRIEDVPPGTYVLAVWNAHAKGPERTITVADGKAVEETFALKP